MDANYLWHQGKDALSLADSLATDLATHITNSIGQKGSAVIALSGGSTPKPLFDSLTKLDIDWSKVLITLVDERWVDRTHGLSNEAFVQRYLLDYLPSSVEFFPLYRASDSAKQSLSEVLAEYCAQTKSRPVSPRSFDAVVLGMGGDGHTASFFPDADNIDELVDQNAPNYLYSCDSQTTQVERITWSLPMLLDASFLALHFTGPEKEAVFNRAIQTGDGADATRRLPIRSVLFQNRTTVNVYYAN